LIVFVSNPGKLTATLYRPGSREETAAMPWPSELASRLVPLARVTSTRAPGMTAPLGSWTTMWRMPDVGRGPCPARVAVAVPARAKTQARITFTRFTQLPLPSLLAVELLRIDLRIDLYLADGPLLHRRAGRCAPARGRKLAPILLAPVIEVQRVIDHRRRL